MAPRARRVAVTVGLALVGLLLVAVGLDREHVRCDRAAGICSITSGLPLLARTDDIPLTAIREHRFAEHRGRKGSTRGATVLIDAAGRERSIARDAEAAARSKYDALHAFFAGERPAVEVDTGPTWWIAAIGALLLLGSPWILRDDAAARARPASDAPRPGARAPWIALAVGALVLVSLAASILSSRTRGTLALRCTQRCEVDGGTCMPGAEMLLTLPPGEHEVRVFNPDDPARPRIERVTLVRGQVTHHECAP